MMRSRSLGKQNVCAGMGSDSFVWSMDIVNGYWTRGFAPPGNGMGTQTTVSFWPPVQSRVTLTSELNSYLSRSSRITWTISYSNRAKIGGKSEFRKENQATAYYPTKIELSKYPTSEQNSNKAPSRITKKNELNTCSKWYSISISHGLKLSSPPSPLFGSSPTGIHRIPPPSFLYHAPYQTVCDENKENVLQGSAKVSAQELQTFQKWLRQVGEGGVVLVTLYTVAWSTLNKGFLTIQQIAAWA